MSENSEAIERAVCNWLDSNRYLIQEVIQSSTDKAIEYMAAGCMAAVGKFLDENKDDLKAGIATACAASWATRHSGPS